MTLCPKTTAAIKMGSWTTIQMQTSGANQMGLFYPLDDVANKNLVYEHGIWKFPKQPLGGAFKIPEDTRQPTRLLCLLADLGASVPWEIHVTNVLNTTGTPYEVADAGLYDDGDITIMAGTSQYIRQNFNIVANGTTALLFPGQIVYIVTAGAVEPLVRLTMTLAYDLK